MPDIPDPIMALAFLLPPLALCLWFLLDVLRPARFWDSMLLCFQFLHCCQIRQFVLGQVMYNSTDYLPVVHNSNRFLVVANFDFCNGYQAVNISSVAKWLLLTCSNSSSNGNCSGLVHHFYHNIALLNNFF